MHRLLAVAALLAMSTGCLVVERTSFRFDLANGTGELRFLNVGTDDANAIEADFAELVNTYVRGTKVEQDHPTWQIASKTLYEENQSLNGLITFGIQTHEDANLYKHDKKSAYIGCVQSSEGTLVTTNGRPIDVLPGCIAWDRKTKVFEYTVTSGSAPTVSLLDRYKAWDGGPVQAPEGAAGSWEGLTGAMGELGTALGGLMGGSATLVEPWTSMGLPIEDGVLVYSDAGSITLTYPGGDRVNELMQKWDVALTAQGYKKTFSSAESGVGSATFEKDGKGVSLGITSFGGGDTSLSAVLY